MYSEHNIRYPSGLTFCRGDDETNRGFPRNFCSIRESKYTPITIEVLNLFTHARSVFNDRRNKLNTFTGVANCRGVPPVCLAWHEEDPRIEPGSVHDKCFEIFFQFGPLHHLR